MLLCSLRKLRLHQFISGIIFVVFHVLLFKFEMIILM